MDERSRRAVETAEGYADGQATAGELRIAEESAAAVIRDHRGLLEITVPAMDAKMAAAKNLSIKHIISIDAKLLASRNVPLKQCLPAARDAEKCRLLRCIFGNPYRPALAVDPSWLAWNGGTVAKLAAAIYDERRLIDLPILADALEDAGCTDAAILGHCREAGEHVRGCWVVDLLTGRQ
jgi:hypothetical protein